MVALRIIGGQHGCELTQPAAHSRRYLRGGGSGGVFRFRVTECLEAVLYCRTQGGWLVAEDDCPND